MEVDRLPAPDHPTPGYRPRTDPRIDPLESRTSAAKSPARQRSCDTGGRWLDETISPYLGTTKLGGDDWDRRIVQHSVRRVRDQHGTEATHDVGAMERLQDAVKAAKAKLSSDVPPPSSCLTSPPVRMVRCTSSRRP